MIDFSELYIPQKPAIIRAHQGDLDGLKQLEREKGIKAILPGMVPVFAQTRRVSGSYTDGATDTAAGTTHTFTNRSIGAVPAAGETRHIIVCVGLVGGDLSTFLLAGSGATLLVGPISQASNAYSRIYGASVATGTTATINVNSGVPTTVGIAVYRLIGASLTPFNTTSDTTDPISMSLTTPSNGYAIASTINRNRGAATWTNLTERFDADAGTTDFFSSASDDTTGSTLSIGVATTGGNEITGVAASFGVP